MKYLSLLVLIAAALCTRGQNTTVFKVAFKPGKVYKTSLNSSSEVTMDLGAIAGNANLPAAITSTSDVSITTTTGQLAGDNSLPAKIVYEHVNITGNMPGGANTGINNFNGLTIKGAYTADNTFRIDSITGGNVNADAKAMIQSTMKNFQQQVIFPTHPMQVGESFEQRLPADVPMPGLSSAKISSKTVYKLKEIVNGKAIFDMVQTMTIDQPGAETSISGTGQGSGISEFDVEKGTITKYQAELVMEMTMKINDMTMGSKVKSTSTQVTTVDE